MSTEVLKKINFRVGKYSALAAPSAVFLFAVATINPATQLERDLQSVALNGSEQIAQNNIASDNISNSYRAGTPEARSEDFWLSPSFNEKGLESVGWKAPVSVGDHVIVNYGLSSQKTLLVLGVRNVLNQAVNRNARTKIETEEFSETGYILTCQDPLEKNSSLIELQIEENGRSLRALRKLDQTL